MWTYLKYLFQLILAPSRGWEDISESALPFAYAVRSGFMPLAGLAALSEFAPMAYSHSLHFSDALINAIAIGGGFAASLPAVKIILELAIHRYVNPNVNQAKTDNLALYCVGLDCIYRIISNCLPGSLTFLSFLPLITLLVLFRSTKYIDVGQDHTVSYILLSFIIVVAIPMAICSILSLIG